MVTHEPPRRMLLADIGSVSTHTALVERAAGIYRLTARADTPTQTREGVDLVRSLVEGIRQLQTLVHRSLLDEEDVPLMHASWGQGIDTLAVTTSAGAPLRCALIGLTQDRSLRTGRTACQSAGALVTEEITLTDERALRHQALARLRQSQPEVIVMLGGVDAGPTQPLVNAAALLATLFADLAPAQRPIVVFAGNLEARRAIVDALGSDLEYHVVENTRPGENHSSPQELERELVRLYAEHRLPQLDGYADVAAWAGTPVLSTRAGLGIVLQFLSQQGAYGTRVLGLDVGGSGTLAALAGDTQAMVMAGQRGLAGGLGTLLRGDGLSRIQSELPDARTAALAPMLLRNHSLRPYSLPEDAAERNLLLATAQIALEEPLAVLNAAYPGAPAAADLIAARGSVFSRSGCDALAMLAILNAVQPIGKTRVVLDWASLWPQLGALARSEPLAALQVLQHDGLRTLGTAVTVTGQTTTRRRLPGRPAPARAAARVRLARESDVFETEITTGALQRLPLSEGSATLQAWPDAHVSLGQGTPGEYVQLGVHGGSVGLVIDARGRPLVLSDDPDVRHHEVETWQSALS